MYLASGVRDKKFAGFAIATTTAPDSITGTFYSQGVGTNTALGEQSDGYAQINQPFRKDIFDLSGNLIQTNFTAGTASIAATIPLLNLGSQVEQDYALDRTHRDKATDYTYSTTTGDLLTQTDYGEVTGNSDGTFTDTGTDKRTTQLTYAASSSSIKVRVTEKKKLDNASSTVSDQKLYYDNLSFGQVRSATTHAKKIGSRHHLRQLHQDLQRLRPRRHLHRPPRLCHRLPIRRVQSLRRDRDQSAQSKDAILVHLRQRQTQAHDRSEQPPHKESLRRRRPPLRSRSVRRLQSGPPRDLDHLSIHRQHHVAVDRSSRRLSLGHQHGRHLRLLRRLQPSRAGT